MVLDCSDVPWSLGASNCLDYIERCFLDFSFMYVYSFFDITEMIRKGMNRLRFIHPFISRLCI